MGGSCEIRIDRGYPYLFNNVELTGKLISLSAEYLGENNVKPLQQKMGAEDFSYFAREAPACFYGLGIAGPDQGNGPNLHTAGFDVDETSMKTGMGLMAWLTVKTLNGLK